MSRTDSTPRRSGKRRRWTDADRRVVKGVRDAAASLEAARAPIEPQTTSVHGPTQKLLDVKEALELAGWNVVAASNGGPTGHVTVSGSGHQFVELITGERWGYYRDASLDLDLAQQG